MAQWYVKDLSKLTQVSVQTLHHYDRIGLLKPSVRQANDYRLYSEKDLLKLQQILALKFFGFSLSQIKTLLSKEVDMIDHFSVQSQLLEEKARTFSEASKALQEIISDCNHDKSIPWENIIKLIEVYRMTQQLEKTWAGKVLTQEELKQYANFEQELKIKYTESQADAYQKAWRDLGKEIEANLDKDPASDLGIALGKRCMDWVNKLYGNKYFMLKKAIWEKGFKGGYINAERGLSAEGVAWLDKAIYAYHTSRIRNVLSKIGIESDKEVLKLWEALLADLCGDDQSSKDELYQKVMEIDKVSPEAKNWLKKINKK